MTIPHHQLGQYVHNLGVILIMNKADIFKPDPDQTPAQAARTIAIEMGRAKKAITLLQNTLNEAENINPDWIGITNAAAERCETYLREACAQYRTTLSL